MMKIYADERRELILSYLSINKRATVKQLSDYANVSEATIRSDLSALQQEQKLERTHGGAKLIKSNTNNINFNERRNQHHRAKEKIGQHALKKIENHQCILLDASSTTYELAKVLADTDLQLTVLTNGLENAILLKENPNLTVLMIGGFVTKGSNAITGKLDSQILDIYNIDYFFVSANGFTVKNGLTDFSFSEVELKKVMASQSTYVVALLDHSKFNVSSTLSFAKTTEIDEIITDKPLSKEFMEATSVEITIAD